MLSKSRRSSSDLVLASTGRRAGAAPAGAIASGRGEAGSSRVGSVPRPKNCDMMDRTIDARGKQGVGVGAGVFVRRSAADCGAGPGNK